MTDDSHVRTDVPLDEAPDAVREEAEKYDDSEVNAHKCAGHGDWIYTVRNGTGEIKAEYNEIGDYVRGPLHYLGDPHADPWKPGAEDEARHLCDQCHDDIRERGGFIHLRSAQGNRLTLQRKWSILTRASYHEYDDRGHTHKHVCIDAVEALVRGDDTLPFDAGWYATTEGDRQIDGDEWVNALDYSKPHNVPSGHSAQEGFAEAVFDGDVGLPTPCVWIGSRLYVPEGDVERARERFEEYAKGQMPV